MSIRHVVPLFVIAALLLPGCQSSDENSGSSGSSSSSADSADMKKKENQADVDRMASATLQRLYNLQPKAEKVVNNAAGYAVFSNFGMQIIVLGGAGGEGVAIDSRSGKHTYMKMAQAQVGLGLAVQKYQMVWVFQTQDNINQFVNSGWELGAGGSAAAKASDSGPAAEGALSIAPGVWLYQMTDTGLALELTAKGTKFFKDNELN